MQFLIKIVTILFAVFAPARQWAACAANTGGLYYFENSPSDSCNSNTLTNNGPVSYVTSPSPYQGTYAAGDYDATHYFSEASGLCTAMSGLSTWSVEGAVYVNSLVNQSTFVSMSNGLLGDAAAIKQQLDGTVRVIINDNAYDSAAGVMTAGAWYYVALEYDGTHVRAYCNLTGSATTKVVDQTLNPNLGTVTTINLGRLNVAGFYFPLNGYLDAWRFNTVSRNGSYPTTDGFTPTFTATISPTFTATKTPTISPTFSATPTFSNTPTPAPSNGLARKPPMFWDSWLPYGLNVTDANIRTTADAMVSSGMLAAGWDTIMIDAGWKTGSRNGSGDLVPNSNFPDMASLAAYVHSKGMKLGIYTSAGTVDCGLAGQPGSYGYEQKDAALFASWNMDMVYDDWCGVTGLIPYNQAVTFWNAIFLAGRAMLFDMNSFGTGNPEVFGPVATNMWRTGPDSSDTWGSTVNDFATALPLAPYATAGNWVDIGGTQTGNGGQPLESYQARFSINCMLPSCMVANTNIPNASAATLSVFNNAEAVAINQDSAGHPCFLAHDYGLGKQVYGRPLARSGTWAVMLFNDNPATRSITVTWSDLAAYSYSTVASVARPAKVRDVWAHANMGRFATSYSQTVLGNSAALLTVNFNPQSQPDGVPDKMKK